MFLAANVPSNLMLFSKIHEYKRVDVIQGGGGYFHDTTLRTQPPKHIFLLYLLINQIYVPHTHVV